MNLREKQIVRLLVQEAVKNNSKYVEYYLSQLKVEQQTNAILALKKVISSSSQPNNTLCLSVKSLIDVGEEGIVKKMFIRTMNQSGKSNKTIS